jgi:membrane-associated phospholipid phosphatase
LTYPPPKVQSFTPLVFAILIVRRAWGPFKRCERTLLAASVSIVLAEQFKDSLAFVFGRYWPDTWVKGNPSLIRNNAYGFNPFHAGEWYRSFPSGHTARTWAFLAPIWIGYRRLRWLCAPAALAVIVGLIGMNYHFVSDIIAGGFIGGIIGTYTAYFCGVAPPIQPDPVAID